MAAPTRSSARPCPCLRIQPILALPPSPPPPPPPPASAICPPFPPSTLPRR